MHRLVYGEYRARVSKVRVYCSTQHIWYLRVKALTNRKAQNWAVQKLSQLKPYLARLSPVLRALSHCYYSQEPQLKWKLGPVLKALIDVYLRSQPVVVGPELSKPKLSFARPLLASLHRHVLALGLIDSEVPPHHEHLLGHCLIEYPLLKTGCRSSASQADCRNCPILLESEVAIHPGRSKQTQMSPKHRP